MKLYTELSPWFIILCIALGLVYAYVLYQKKGPWNELTNKILFGLRAFLVAFIAFLLIGPLVKYIKNNIEKPTIVIAVDNSQSIPLGADSAKLGSLKNSLTSFTKKLEDKGVKVNVQLLNKSIVPSDITSLSFENYTSNISGMLNEVQSNFENRNLSGIVLVTDGIYNQGSSPTYNQYTFPIFSIGIGDTIPKKDINLKSVLYNKISYLGNQFPIVAEIHNHGFSNQKLTVNLKQAGKVLQSKTVNSGKSNDLIEVEFRQSSESKGMQHYVVEVEPVSGEFTYKNNSAHAYIDIIEGKEKILICALTPHPDIKALKSALETKETYQVDTYIPGLNNFKEEPYDLVIFHQLPDFTNTANTLIDKFTKNKTALLFIVGNQTNIGAFNTINETLKINARRGQFDNVTPGFNPSFDKFKTLLEEQNIINTYPPLSVPFGDIGLKGNADIVLYQRIGKIVSTKPLIALSNNNGKKTGVIVGEGIWDWRLTEFNMNGNTDVFDKFIGNLVQFLSTKDDKRKFRVYPAQNEFLVSDRVILEVEAYNDVYEKVYGQKVDLNVKGEDGKNFQYSFTTSESNSRFEIKGLKSGIYKYSATTTLSGRQEKSSGEFTIQELLLETINTTADFSMLRNLSASTSGKFFYPNQIDHLADYLINNNAKSIIHSNEELVEIVNLPWIFFLILILVSMEWFIRKYRGGY